jgi:imidazole glycerol-phosphate synthase subunit HisF
MRPLPRVIPVLLLSGSNIVKTIRFRKPTYIGDPINTVRIFNELRVDEIIVLDIGAATSSRGPDWALIAELASECDMPMCYGGGVGSVEQARRLFGIGIEKVSVNSAAIHDVSLVSDLADEFGSQSVVGSIDAFRSSRSRLTVRATRRGNCFRNQPVAWAETLVKSGAGEILLTAVHREGTWTGFDIPLVRAVSDAVSVPVIAHGGCGCLADISDVVTTGGASAVGVGSYVVFQKKGFGVLVNFPKKENLREMFS